jgi:hypothetical protein
MTRLDSQKQSFPRSADRVSVGRVSFENCNSRKINYMKGNNSTTVEGMQTASQHYVSKVKGKR